MPLKHKETVKQTKLDEAIAGLTVGTPTQPPFPHYCRISSTNTRASINTQCGANFLVHRIKTGLPLIKIKTIPWLFTNQKPVFTDQRNNFVPRKASGEAKEINSFIAPFWNNITFANWETLSQTKWLAWKKKFPDFPLT